MYLNFADAKRANSDFKLTSIEDLEHLNQILVQNAVQVVHLKYSWLFQSTLFLDDFLCQNDDISH